MVPLGKKALMKGSLVHTNEVLIFVGADTFIKRSATGAKSVCQRMISRCDQTIQDFKKEYNLLMSNKALIENQLLEDNADHTDLTIFYNEEDVKMWFAKHRENVKKHKKQEHIERQEWDQKPHEELMQRLEELELQEELRKEWLPESDNANFEECSESSLSSESSDDEEEEEPNSKACHVKSTTTSDAKTVELSKRRVSFANTTLEEKGARDILQTAEQEQSRKNGHIEQKSDIQAVPVIKFRHSVFKEEFVEKSKNDICAQFVPVTPSDITRMYATCNKQKSVKSILKKSSKYSEFNSAHEGGDRSDYKILDDDVLKQKYCSQMEEECKPTIEVFGDIVERKPNQIIVQEQQRRPVSKFKASRRPH